jgi:hypothetical protein
VFVPENATAFVCAAVRLSVNLPATSGDTVTVRRSVPLAEMDPSVTAMVAVSAFDRRIRPFAPPDTVASPATNEIAVVPPKEMAVPLAFATVGGVTGSGEEEAPENTRFFVPVYPVALLPDVSRAVMVRFWA